MCALRQCVTRCCLKGAPYNINNISYDLSYISHVLHPREFMELTNDQLPVGLIAQLVLSQRSWVRIPFKPKNFQPFPHLLKLNWILYCDDLYLLIRFPYCFYPYSAASKNERFDVWLCLTDNSLK